MNNNSKIETHGRHIMWIIAFMVLGMNALLTGTVSAGVDQGILNIHVTFSGDPAHDVTVSWRTEEPLTSAQLRFGPMGTDERNWVERQGETVASAGGYNHHVPLHGLEPDTRYAYRVLSPHDGWGPVCSFRTAPTEGDTFTFAVVGDVQGKEQASIPWQDAGEWLAAQEDLLFVWLMGDQVDTGFSQLQWDAFFNSLEQEHSRQLFHSTVIMPLLGNHDYYGGELNNQGVELYLDQFRLPPNGIPEWEGRFFTFNILNAKFITLDTEGDRPDSDAYFADQTRWMKTLDWEARPWRMVAHHRGPYQFRRHVPSSHARDIWRPHFYDRYTQLVFNGHNHSQAASVPLRAERLDGLNGGRGFTGPWQGVQDSGCATSLPNLLLLEDNQLIQYPGYEAVGRSVNTTTRGSLEGRRPIHARRPIEPIATGPGTELWVGYLYQKLDGWYATNQGGIRLQAADNEDRYLQVATTRVDTEDDGRWGHLAVHLGREYQVASTPIAREGRNHIPEDAIFVLAKYVFHEGRTQGFLKSYRAPEALPQTEPTEWDAIVEINETWATELDTLVLLGESQRRDGLLDEIRVGRQLTDVLLQSQTHVTSPSGRALVKERFDIVPTVNPGDGVVYYDAGGINSSGAANQDWYIRFREDRSRMPLVALFTVTPESINGQTVFFADFEEWSTGDVIDEFTILRRAD